jgi:solute:Na+ symporter, SSS family
MRQAVDLVIIAAYLIGTTLFGCSFYFRKGTKGEAEEFTKGGGRLPSWALALSIFAAYVSSISFLALPAKAYLESWNALVLSFSIPVAAGIAAVWFVPFYRKQTSASAYTFLEARFGAWARLYASGCFLVMQSVRSGMILFLLALLLNTMMGYSIPVVICVVGLATMLYSMMGGLCAVVWTDAVQGILLITGAVVCLVVLCLTMPNGFAAGVETAWEAGKFSLGDFSFSDWGHETFWVTFLYGVFLNLQNFGIDQSYTQRYIAARNEREAVRSMFSGAMLYVPVSLVFVAIGTLLWAWVKAHPGLVPAEVLAHSDAVFPWFIVNELPMGVSGLLIAAIIAAAMSTVSATLNSSATVLLEDYRKRFAKGEVSGKSQIRFLRGATMGLGIFAVGVALAVMNVTSVLTTWWGLQSVLSGGMLGLFLLGAFAKRTKKSAAVVATVVGIGAVAWISLGAKVFHVPQFLHINLALVVGTLALVVTGFVLGFVVPKKEERMAK